MSREEEWKTKTQNTQLKQKIQPEGICYLFFFIHHNIIIPFFSHSHCDLLTNDVKIVLVTKHITQETKKKLIQHKNTDHVIINRVRI